MTSTNTHGALRSSISAVLLLGAFAGSGPIMGRLLAWLKQPVSGLSREELQFLVSILGLLGSILRLLQETLPTPPAWIGWLYKFLLLLRDWLTSLAVRP